MNSNMKNLNRAFRDREEENKKLILQMSEIRKHEENYDETEQQEEMMEEDAMDTQDHRQEDDRMEGEPMEGQEIEDM